MFNGAMIFAIFLVGAWGLVVKRHLIKKVIALNIISSAIVILFIYLGSLQGASAPILVDSVSNIVDPIPQALMLTAIVVGVCTTALALVLAYKIYRAYQTLDLTEIERAAEHDNE